MKKFVILTMLLVGTLLVCTTPKSISQKANIESKSCVGPLPEYGHPGNGPVKTVGA